jgi:hypothetical protein
LISHFIRNSVYAFFGVFSTFFLPIATVQRVTTINAAITEINAALLNSGTFGVEDVDVVGVEEANPVGLGEADVLEESDITETVLSPELTTNISPLAES